MPPEKDPHSPKEPLTALDFYVQARRHEEEKEAAAKETNNGKYGADSSVSRHKMEFDNLSDIDKATWYKLAKMDRIRYRREMATYEPPIDNTSSTPILAIMGRFFPFSSDGVPFAGTTLIIKEAQNSSHIGEDGGTGLNVWDGAMLLTRYIEKVPNIVKNKKVIELGSGCGVVGIAAAICGCKQVVMTDLSYALPLMRTNVDRNKSAWKDNVIVSCKECDWFNPPNVDELLLDQNCEIIKSNYPDVILVADCVWISSLIAPLLHTLKQYTSESTEVFITYQQRGREAHEMFMEGVHEHFDVVDVDTLEEAGLVKPDVFHLLRCKRKVS